MACITVLMFKASDLPDDLIQWGQGDGDEVIHIAYQLPGEVGNGWTLSAGGRGLFPYPSERFGGATVSWPQDHLTDAETAAWVVGLRATVGESYGFNAIVDDLVARFDRKLAEGIARKIHLGLVCSSQGAATLLSASPATYQKYFGTAMPQLIEPTDWHQAYLASAVPAIVPIPVSA